MGNSFWMSPSFIVSLAFTLGVAYYSYVYLPMKMNKAYRQSLLTLARTVETKDIGAAGHGERVAGYVVAVARAMRISRKETLKMEYAAFLQDIGNVQVPHYILNKSTSLSETEFEILKQHTVVGAEMVGEIQFLKSIAPIIRHHHESWDGSGYPDGLKGSDIPDGARILAVCTGYDSMVHARSYRDGMDRDQAIREIRMLAGSKYDPKVVETFLRVLKKREIEEERKG
jgi:HD-GYP domain-containing protein (c-di-GMP phosphodiesterase class II)